MKKLTLISGLLIILAFLGCFSKANAQQQPNAAGTFYPNDKTELLSLLNSLLDSVNLPPEDNINIFAIIAPHAGYGYSGKTAAYGYKTIQGKPYKTVIIIGPSHYYHFSGISIYPEGSFQTPLGDIEIDKDFTSKLLSKDNDVFSEPRAFEKEHSIEVQLPFLQKTLTDFKIVPIVMGDCTLIMCEKFSSLLKEAIGGRKDVLVIASSDMYHGYDYTEAEKTDKLTLSHIENMDASGLYYGIRDGKLQLCGGFPAVSTIMLAKELGYNKTKLLNYTNSALVTGRKIRGVWTVGYSCLLIGNENKENTEMLNNAQEKKLLDIARQSIKTYLETGKKSEISETDPVLTKVMGAFVTLHKDGQLRGCIGNIIGRQPLYLTVKDMAVEAAVGDPRFEPLDLSELEDIEIEISVLTPPEKISSSEAIKLSIHGVVLQQGPYSAVFLPQVASETGWNKEEFLSHLAQKAGLSADAWKDKNTQFQVFEAIVFSEQQKDK